VSLATAPAFLELLPGGGEVGFSALAYQRLGDVLTGLAGLVPGSGELSPDQAKALENASASLSSSLSYAYAGDDRIRVAHSADGGLLGLSSLFGVFAGGW